MTTSEKDAYAYLTITSQSHSLDQITAHMGCAPDGKSWSQGDARTKVGDHTFSRWSLMSGVECGQPLEQHFAALIARMEPLDARLAKLPDGMHAGVSITGWVAKWSDEIAFSAASLRGMAGFGLPLDFDLYAEEDPA